MPPARELRSGDRVEAIILAAGLGSRLGPHTAERPKALVHVAGASILERQLAALCAVPEVERVTVVVGYRAEQIEIELARLNPALPFRTVYNPFYAEVGALTSLWLALQHGPTSFAVMNGDTVFAPESLRRLVRSEHDLALLCSPAREPAPDAVKVVAGLHGLVTVGKDVPAGLATGESAGVFRCAGEGAKAAVATAERMLRDPSGLRAYWHALVQQLVDDGYPVAFTECDPGSWVEVDDGRDLAFAGDACRGRTFGRVLHATVRERAGIAGVSAAGR